MLYTKTQAPSVRFVANLLVEYVDMMSTRWSLSLTVHMHANNRQLLLCVAICYHSASASADILVTFCVTFRIFVVGEHRDFKLGTQVDCS